MQTTIENNITLGQLATQNPHNADIFRKYNLDFCCGGRKTLQKACAEKGLDQVLIEKELQAIAANPNGHFLRYNDWEPDFLAGYIENTHHAFVKNRLPEIMAYALKVANAHGSKHPELATILNLLKEINEELFAHMAKEEKVLFPYIKKQVLAYSNAIPLDIPFFGNIENPVSVMEAEHELVGKNMEEIKTLSNNYTPPSDACNSYKLLYKLLDEFEADLHIHIHLENNILFPKSIALQKQLLAGNLPAKADSAQACCTLATSK